MHVDVFSVSVDGVRTVTLRSTLPRQDPDVQIEIPFDKLVYNGKLGLLFGHFVALKCTK